MVLCPEQATTTVTEENGRLAIDIANDHNNNGNSNNANRKTKTLPIQQWQLNGRQRLRNLAATGFSEWANAISHKAWTLKHVYNSFFSRWSAEKYVISDPYDVESMSRVMIATVNISTKFQFDSTVVNEL